MIFEPSGHVHDPRNQLLLTLETPHYLKRYDIPNYVGEIIVLRIFKNLKAEIVGNAAFLNVWKLQYNAN